MSPLTHETVIHSVHVLEACWALIGTIVILALLDEWRVRRRGNRPHPSASPLTQAPHADTRPPTIAAGH